MSVTRVDPSKIALVMSFGVFVAAACSNSAQTGGAGGSSGVGGASGLGGQDQTSAQLPPEGATAVEAWLQAASYKQWHCEAAVHEARSPSPHGFNRICSNDALAGNTAATWPVGAAAVKELYATATATVPVGYAVYKKKQANSAGGAGWYWYERVPLDSTAPHDAAGVVADGTGDSGVAMSFCVGCHAAAGSDVAHTPSTGGRDQVYTPVSTAAGAAQAPPEGAAAVEAWLTAGSYKLWHCEGAVHAARSPSPHGFNRICSNEVVASHASSTDAWPAGAAAVKELYATATASAPTGYAVYKKKQANSAGGAGWYWYERVPLDSTAPHDAAGVVADGTGDSGVAMSFCVGCHAAAGSDVAHTPSPGGHDQIYTPVSKN